MLKFILGLLIGAALGIMTLAICVASGRADDCARCLLNKDNNKNTDKDLD